MFNICNICKSECYYCSLEGSTYKRCNFEKGFCDLTQSSETFSEWARTTEASGLKHDHSNTSGSSVSHLPHGTFWMLQLQLIVSLVYSCSIFPVPVARWSKQNHSRSDQSGFHSHSDLSGNFRINQDKAMIHMISAPRASFHSYPSDEFLLLCWDDTWRSPGPGPDSSSGSEHRDVEELRATADGNMAAGSDSVLQ